MGKYTTIPVSVEVKKILEAEKGKMSWDEFLLSLLRAKKEKEEKEAIERIKRRLKVSEAFIIESEENMRRGLKFEELY